MRLLPLLLLASGLAACHQPEHVGAAYRQSVTGEIALAVDEGRCSALSETTAIKGPIEDEYAADEARSRCGLLVIPGPPSGRDQRLFVVPVSDLGGPKWLDTTTD